MHFSQRFSFLKPALSDRSSARFFFGERNDATFERFCESSQTVCVGVRSLHAAFTHRGPFYCSVHVRTRVEEALLVYAYQYSLLIGNAATPSWN